VPPLARTGRAGPESGRVAISAHLTRSTCSQTLFANEPLREDGRIRYIEGLLTKAAVPEE
jgi:hypothetical protein